MVTVIEAPVAPARPVAVPRRIPAWVVGVVPTVVAVLLAVASHAWGIARTDDWSFARVAYALHTTGHIHLVGWSQMNLLGLVAWAQPWLWIFGDHQWVLDGSSAALVAIGIAAAFHVARRLTGQKRALVVVGTLVIFPGFLRDVPSFMTDGPAFAVQAVVLAVGVAALEATGRRRTMLVWAVVGLGLFGFTIREFAIAAPLAVLGALFLQRHRAALRPIAALLVASAAFYLWRQGMPSSQGLGTHPDGLVVAGTLVQAGCTVCLGLVPVLAWTARGWWQPVARRARVRGFLVGVTMAAVPLGLRGSMADAPQWLIGHYLDRAGVNGNVDTLGIRPQLLPGPLWAALSVVAIGAFVLVCGLIAEAVATRTTRATRSRQSGETVLILHVGLMVAACAAAALLKGGLFDRYLWPIVLSAALLILCRYPVSASRRAFAAACAGLVILALALTVNSNSFDVARWRAGQQLVADGLPAQSVDAGFEWTGAHATAPADLAGPYAGGDAVSWWTKWFPHPTICALVTASPVRHAGFALERTERWNLLGAAVPERLYVYRNVNPGCPR